MYKDGGGRDEGRETGECLGREGGREGQAGRQGVRVYTRPLPAGLLPLPLPCVETGCPPLPLVPP